MEAPSVLAHSVLIFSVIAGSYDLVTRKIPNFLVILGSLTAVAGILVFGEILLLLHTVVFGMFVAAAVFLPFYLVKGMAAGDVKMMMVIGAFVGPLAVFKIALLTFLIGGIAALAIVACSGKTRAALANMHVILLNHVLRASLPRGTSPTNDEIVFPSVGRMPYGPAIALATAIVVLGQ